MGYFGWDPPEYDEPSDSFIEEATDRWYEMQADENEDCMFSLDDYLRDSKMMAFIVEDLYKLIDDGESFYCETDDPEDNDNRLRAIKIKNHLNLLDKISNRIRSYVDNDLEYSCITSDDEDFEWIYELACELDKEASEPDPDAAYEAWRDQQYFGY